MTLLKSEEGLVTLCKTIRVLYVTYPIIYVSLSVIVVESNHQINACPRPVVLLLFSLGLSQGDVFPC